VICVADAFSAMTAERPYRPRIPPEEACRELERCAGTQFDPAVVHVFVEAVRANPPGPLEGALASALDDPEVRGLRGDQPLLGLSELSVTDSLTLLYTHSYFHAAVRSEAERAEVQGRPLAVVLFELLDLGEINRRDGYAAADAAIRAVAWAIHDAAEAFRGTAARHAGRRLGLLLPGADRGRAEEVADDVRRGAREHSHVGFGIAAWSPGEPADALVERALHALRHGGAETAAAHASRAASRGGGLG
jgi:diguanylate cyclase (GGDEF)-like protein